MTAFPCAGLLADVPQSASSNYLQNGSFTGTGTSLLNGWSQINTAIPVTTGTEGVDNFVSAASSNVTTATGIQQIVPIHGEWAKVLLRGDIRVVFQSAGPAPTNSGDPSAPFIGVGLTWQDKTGHSIAVTNAQDWEYTTPGWVEINQLLDVPPTATALILSPKVNHANASAYFKDLSLTCWVSSFKDTFAGNTLDPSRWGFTTGKHNVAADEQQWFTPDELSVANNMLRITAERKPINGFAFQSGQVSTITKFQQLYGIFEFQLKLPVTSGAWPAAYLLPWNDDWPPEIDVEEMSGRDPGVVRETNHYSDEYGRHRSSQDNFSADGIDRTQLHTYSVVWEPGQLGWYFDGIFKGEMSQPYDDVSDVPMYITLNLAVGAYGGDPSTSTWPQYFDAKEVGAYQRADLPLPLYPGDDQEITLPQNTAALTAISCNPVDSLTVTWKLIEGPAVVKIRNPRSITTTATFTKPGMYRFEIKVSKGASSNTGQYLVFVNKAIGK